MRIARSGKACFDLAAAVVALLAVLAAPAGLFAQGVDRTKLVGVVVDNAQATLTGKWKPSTSVPPFVDAGYIHDDNTAKGERQVRFATKLPKAGEYEVRLSYCAGGSRATNVPVEIHFAGGMKTVTVNQRKSPPGGAPFLSLGKFRFEAEAVVVISNKDTNGHVIVDAVQFLLPDQLAEAKKQDANLKATTLAKKPAAKKKPAPPKQVAVWKKPDRKPVVKLNSDQLDALVTKALGKAPVAPPLDDEAFLRRVSLDLIGRQPSPAEMDKFLANKSPRKRAVTIDQLLASEEFGKNWANYWSDVIRYRTPQPQLTFLNYTPLKTWLAERLNDGAGWDEITWKLITATGKVSDNPAATFIGFHEANIERITGETARVFLGVQLTCAECHDHKFESWEQNQFHHLAAFFARTQATLPHNNSGAIEVKSKAKGEHRLPDGRKQELAPAFFDSEPLAKGLSDIDRRKALADWLTSGKSEFFALSYTNRIWSRLLGRGFYEPADHLSENVTPRLPEVHEALSEHFDAGGYNIKELFRLIANTQAYQRSLGVGEAKKKDYIAATTQQLRGDEIFDSLVATLKLPNVKGEQKKVTGDFRFPPPPKSTRDLVNDAFGFDPSVDLKTVPRTMKQAMWMMNNAQLQKQIDADPKSGTMLAQLLAEEKDDRKALVRLFRLALARQPGEKEIKIGLGHLADMKDRGQAFEDILWSLVNTAEFTTKR
jgi:hypothetical protein